MSTIDDEIEIAAVIDVDSHILEPANLWVERLPQKMRDVAPRVVWDEDSSEERWQIGDIRLGGAAHLGVAGWREPFPYFPASIGEAPLAGYDATARLGWLDEQGIQAQVLYPNLLGFDAHVFLVLGADVALACVRAYNDFMTEWCSADPDRLIAIMALPFWDMDASVIELERCHEAGHRGILMAAHYEKAGFTNVSDPQWAPVLSRAQELGLSINFHVGFSKRPLEELRGRYQTQTRGYIESMNEAELEKYVVNSVSTSSPGFLSNAQAIADVICNGLCQRYPELNFVSVESGFGYMPFLLQNLDWQWRNNGVSRVDPSFDLLPSEYFRRQIYSTLWFERPNVDDLIDLQDNVMFETDFPHPTCQHPGPYTPAVEPEVYADATLAALPDDVLAKVLHDSAARLYRLD